MNIESLQQTLNTLTNERATALETVETLKRQYGASGTQADWKRVQSAKDALEQLDARIATVQEQIAQSTAEAEQARVQGLQSRIVENKARQKDLLAKGEARKAAVADLVNELRSLFNDEATDRAAYDSMSAELVRNYAALGVVAAFEKPAIVMPGTVQPSVVVGKYPLVMSAKELNPIRKLLVG